MTRIVLLLAFSFFSYVFALPRTHAQEGVEFYRDIAPLFVKNCVACHNASEHEGGLNLESYEALMKGGDSGDSIVPDHLEDSYLLARVNGEVEPLMPPEDNAVGAQRFSKEEIELLEKWIRSGAGEGQKMEPSSDIQWQSLPETLQPIYALAASPDGQFLAFGRGNQLLVAPQQVDKGEVQSLVDHQLEKFIQHSGASNTPNTELDQAHLDIVQAVAISPDSQRIASGGFRNVKIWKRVHEPRALLSGLTHDATLTSSSPTGRYLALVGPSVPLEIVDLKSAQSVKYLSADKQSTAAMIWLDENRLLSCDHSGRWYITDAASSRQSALEVDHTLVADSLVRLSEKRIIGIDTAAKIFVLSLVSSSTPSAEIEQPQLDSIADVCCMSLKDAKEPVVALGCSDGQVVIVDPENWKTLKSIETGERPVQLRIDGDRIVTILESSVGLWNLETGQPVAKLERGYDANQKIRFASRSVDRQDSLVERLNGQLPDLEKAAENEREAQKKVQEARDKAAEELAARVKDVENASASLGTSEKALSDAQAALEAARKQVESLMADLEEKKKSLQEAESKKASAEEELQKRDQALATAKESTQRVSARIPEMKQQIESEKSRLGSLRKDLDSLQEESRLPQLAAASFSDDGSDLILAGQDGVIRVFFAEDGSPRANFLALAAGVASLFPDLISQSAAGKNEMGGRRIAGLTRDGQLMSWNLDDQWVLEHSIGDFKESPFTDRVTALDFSPDGKLLAIGSGPPSRAGDVTLIEVDSGSVQQEHAELHSDTVLAIRFSPDGRRLATAGADKMCQTLDVTTGEKLRSFEGHTHHILGLDWQDDGQVLVTASADQTIKLWKSETAEQIRTIDGYAKEVTSARFVGATHEIVSSCADGSIRLHNADNGKQVRTFAGSNDAVFSVGLSGDLSTLFAGGQLGKVWSWQLQDAKLIGSLPKQSSRE